MHNNSDQSNLPATIEHAKSPSVFDKIASHIPESWRRRFTGAVKQLVAGSEKGAALYGEARERLDAIEGRSLVRARLAEAVAEEAIRDPETMERAKAHFLRGMFQDYDNLEAVINGAGEKMLALPAPDATRSSHNAAAQIMEETGDTANGSDPLNPDWAASFSSIAEKASTVELRDRLSRVLAGEIVSPGTFPRATVRLISELEREDIVAVQKILPYVLDNLVIRTRSDPSMPNRGLLLPLVETGLLLELDEFLHRSWPVSPEGGQNVALFGRKWALGVRQNAGQQLNLPISQLTRAGVAVVDLLGRPDERVVLRKIAQEIPAEMCVEMVIGLRLKDDLIGTPLEQVFPQVST